MFSLRAYDIFQVLGTRMHDRVLQCSSENKDIRFLCQCNLEGEVLIEVNPIEKGCCKELEVFIFFDPLRKIKSPCTLFFFLRKLFSAQEAWLKLFSLLLFFADRFNWYNLKKI